MSSPNESSPENLRNINNGSERTVESVKNKISSDKNKNDSANTMMIKVKSAIPRRR